MERMNCFSSQRKRTVTLLDSSLWLPWRIALAKASRKEISMSQRFSSETARLWAMDVKASTTLSIMPTRLWIFMDKTFIKKL